MEIDDGGWSLVWKHSYVEINPLTNMFWHADNTKYCTDLEAGADGWCNIANKSRFKPKEMLVAAYHKSQLVYAYKGWFNADIDHNWQGAEILSPTQIVDHCNDSNSRGVAPYPQEEGERITGLALAKNPIESNTDTWDGNGEDDDRWLNCQLPPSISSRNSDTQMTVAIYVR